MYRARAALVLAFAGLASLIGAFVGQAVASSDARASLAHVEAESYLVMLTMHHALGSGHLSAGEAMEIAAAQRQADASIGRVASLGHPGQAAAIEPALSSYQHQVSSVLVALRAGQGRGAMLLEHLDADPSLGVLQARIERADSVLAASAVAGERDAIAGLAGAILAIVVLFGALGWFAMRSRRKEAAGVMEREALRRSEGRFRVMAEDAQAGRHRPARRQGGHEGRRERLRAGDAGRLPQCAGDDR
ncbi:MAG: hypothetical protein ACYDH5_16445 [Acidimicrobiales bacterium]